MYSIPPVLGPSLWPRQTQRHPVLRFDSLTEMIRHCRRQYCTENVRTEYRALRGDLMLVMFPKGRPVFESLVVHMDGERAYLVELPEKW